jgi:hypothetical protein
VIEERQVVGGDDRWAVGGKVLIAFDVQTEQPPGDRAEDTDQYDSQPAQSTAGTSTIRAVQRGPASAHVTGSKNLHAAPRRRVRT